jgi:PAS domain S-box-containing protein
MRAEVLAAGLAVAVFALDLLTPPEVTVGALYTGVIVLTLWSQRFALPLIAATASTALIALSFFADPPVERRWLVGAHHLLGVLAVWSIAIVAWLRHRSEQAAAEQAEKLHLAVDGARLGVFAWHLPSGVFEGNRRLSELLGRGDRPLDRPIEDFFARIHPDDCELVSGWFTRILETGSAADTEYRYLLPDGTVRWISSHCRPYLDRNGKVERICGALHDVTPRRRADDAHRETEQRLRLALAAAEFGVFDWDTSSDLVRTDERFAHIYGIDGATSVRSVASLFERIHPDDRQVLAETLRSIQSGHGPARIEYRIVRPDGRTRWIATNTRGDPTPGSMPDRIVGVIEDITDLKEADAARERSVERERSARREAEAARATAEAANRTKDEFLAVVSHELRAPLSPILGWTELLREGGLDEDDTREALDTVERNTRSLARLVSDLLDVSRILAGKLPIAPRPTTLEDPVADAIDSLEEAARERGVKLSIRVDADRRLVSGDPERLRQIAWNLISNAIKFTPSGGRVEVEILEAEAWLELVVRDSGKGIEPDVVPHLFERFWQEDGSLTRSTGGLGLGLSIVKHLVERHRGTVSVRSAGTGMGTTFTVRLPALKGRRKSPRPVNASAGPEKVQLSGLRVLAVDDDEATAAATSAVLTYHGAEVRTAGSAAEALALLERWKPGVLLSDLAMPGTDGFTLISEVRRRERGAEHTPAIALSALARVEDRERAFAAGFDGYITKPVDSSTLAAEIAHAAARPEERDTAPSDPTEGAAGSPSP